MSDTRDMQYRKEYKEYPVSNQDGTAGITYNNKRCPAASLQQIQQKLDSIIPTASLPLTPFSAKKVEGKKLYEYAREGNPIYMDTTMELLSYDIVDYDFPNLTLELSVGKGTYIRSIGYRLGRELNLAGILTSLRRTRIGEYLIKDMKFDSYKEKFPISVLENNNQIPFTINK